MKTNTAQRDQSAAQAALDNPRLCALCYRVGVRRLSTEDRGELVSLGLAYLTPRNDGRAGTDMVLTAVGRLAARAGRLAEIVANGGL